MGSRKLSELGEKLFKISCTEKCASLTSQLHSLGHLGDSRGQGLLCPAPQLVCILIRFGVRILKNWVEIFLTLDTLRCYDNSKKLSVTIIKQIVLFLSVF